MMNDSVKERNKNLLSQSGDMLKLIKEKKAFLHSIGEWFIPALIAFALGFGVAYLMFMGVIPDPVGLF